MLNLSAREQGISTCAKSQSTLSAEDLFGFLFCNEHGREYLAMLYHAYIDDSADRNRERVVVAGAIIGKKQDWDTLNRRWNARLAEDGIQYFKSSHCETLNGQFHKFRALGMDEGRPKAAKVRDDLDAIIRSSPVTGLGVTLSVPFHQTMLSDPAAFGEIPTVPYRLAFQQLIAECGKAMQLLRGRGHIVTFGHDNGDDFNALHDLYKEFKKRNPRYSGTLADFVPLDDRLHPPVQAADVAAWITFQFANNYMAGPNGQKMKRLKLSMYKIVNWLAIPEPRRGSDFEDAPAKAIYAP